MHLRRIDLTKTMANDIYTLSACFRLGVKIG